MGMPLELFLSFDPPYERFDNSMLGPEFAAELDLVSRLWFRCGYRPGIAAYLNFFLLKEFIRTHDTNFPPRFRTLRSMADSFYQTDLFIREVTDSGPCRAVASPAPRCASFSGASRSATPRCASRRGCRPILASACLRTSKSSARR